MKRWTYTLFAWLLSAFIFWSIVFDTVSERVNIRTPLGTVEATSPLLDKLTAEFPCGYDVELKAFQDQDSDVWGWTTWDDKREVYEIHFYGLAPRAVVRQTIMHEYAHVLVWDAVQASPHDGIYWAAYGNLYRFVIDE